MRQRIALVVPMFSLPMNCRKSGRALSQETIPMHLLLTVRLCPMLM